jgi:hypothetical protein
MRVGVIGSLEMKDETKVFPMLSNALDGFGMKTISIVTGSAPGVEDVAKSFAYRRGLDCVMFKPAYALDKRIPVTDRHNFLKLVQIVENSDKLIVVDTKTPSENVEGAIKMAKKLGVPILYLLV